MNICKHVIAFVGAAALLVGGVYGLACATETPPPYIQPDWACVHEETNYMFVWSDSLVGRDWNPAGMECQYVGME